MKYIIDVPEEQRHIYDEEDKVLSFLVTNKNSKCNIAIDINAMPYTESDRKAIEDEVWEFVKKIECLTIGETEDCFDVEYEGIPFVANMFSFQEAKSKYEAWLKQKDETFDTGDEVYNKEIDSKGVILRRYNSDTLDILWDDGSAGETFAIKAITKTGRHFPEVAELLGKMRNEEE